jgi:hypothetical protein
LVAVSLPVDTEPSGNATVPVPAANRLPRSGYLLGHSDGWIYLFANEQLFRIRDSNIVLVRPLE